MYFVINIVVTNKHDAYNTAHIAPNYNTSNIFNFRIFSVNILFTIVRRSLLSLFN